MKNAKNLSAPQHQLTLHPAAAADDLTSTSMRAYGCAALRIRSIWIDIHFIANPQFKESAGNNMIREFLYRGETFRVNAHGIHGHEEVFIIHMVDGEEWGEISIDRMTEENDTSAPLEDICVLLCDRLIIEREIKCAEPDAAFSWIESKVAVQVHNGIQDHH